MKKPDNQEIAQLLEQVADLLEAQEANTFRIRAYRNGAASVRAAKKPVASLLKDGDTAALRQLPDIGEGLAALISEYVQTGRSTLLERLQGEITPEDVFTKVPGIGEELATRINRELDIQSLEELEQAAHDGRLAKVEGFGERRVKAVQTALAGLLSRSAQRQSRQRTADQANGERSAIEPPAALLLAIDAQYRQKAAAGELKQIAPRRFNPDKEAWLPILHTEREGWEFTALFSNTKRAHELDMTGDWVVIYFERAGQEQQRTVVTETSGSLQGERVVRGREADSRRYYQEQAAHQEKLF
jgi:Holliday junction resolvasome RuvABC DNA-binding subunit